MGAISDREQEMRDKRRRRLERWYKKLPPHLKKITKSDKQRLVDEGLADENGLTPAGKLRLLQLETLEAMKKRKDREADEI